MPSGESHEAEPVTIYARALPGGNGRAIIRTNGQVYKSGGSRGYRGGGGGVAKISRPSEASLADFPNVLHPEDL